MQARRTSRFEDEPHAAAFASHSSGPQRARAASASVDRPRRAPAPSVEPSRFEPLARDPCEAARRGQERRREAPGRNRATARPSATRYRLDGGRDWETTPWQALDVVRGPAVVPHEVRSARSPATARTQSLPYGPSTIRQPRAINWAWVARTEPSTARCRHRAPPGATPAQSRPELEPRTHGRPLDGVPPRKRHRRPGLRHPGDNALPSRVWTQSVHDPIDVLSLGVETDADRVELRRRDSGKGSSVRIVVT